MAYLDRDDVTIYYESSGSGSPMLLSHGSTSHMWEGQVAAFGDEHKVVAWDMRGHGKTDSPDDQGLYSETATVEDMAAILDAAGETSAIIGGHSLGGYMSLAFYLKYPERTRALMLFDTGPGVQEPQGS